MTARCPSNGPSALKPGAGQQNVVAGAAITGAVLELAPWLLPATAMVDGFIFAATSQCTSDPPPMPTWDANDATTVAIGMLNPNWQQTVTKINNLLLNWAWDQFCECTSGTATPAVPSPQPPQTTVVSGAPAQPCFKGSLSQTPAQCIGVTGELSLHDDVTFALLPTSGPDLTITDAAGTFQVHGVPAGVTRYEWTYTLPEYNFRSGFGPGSVQISFWDSAGNQTGNDHFTNNFPAAAQTFSYHTALPANTAYWRATYYCNANANIGTAISPDILTTQIFCGGNPQGTFTSCCPPDPAVSLALRNITELLTNLTQSVQPPTTGWQDSTRHAGLTGSASFMTGAQTVAIRVETKTLPGGIHTNPGSPNFYYDLGFVTPFVLQSPLRGWRLVFNPETFTLPQFTDQIGYDLAAGAVIDIVELIPK